mmetsp:Transcript_2621/g.5591  ORF Transcript_2621/g.5591 Transcript_2621/m.5591 type:complete len:284 (-) Transcript_2621:6-857(-)
MSTLQKPKKTTRDRDELEGTLLPPAPAPIPMDDPLRLPVASAVAESSVSALPAGATGGNEAASSFSATSPGSSTAAPSATAVPAASSPSIPTVAAVPVVAAVPMNQYEYPSQDAAAEKDKEQAASRGQVAAASAATDDDTIPSAPFLPSYDDSFAEENRDYVETAELHHGNRKGKIQSGEEIEDIDRARRKIHAKQWNEREAVRQANEEAQRRNRSGVQIKEDKWFKYETEKPAYKEKDPDSVPYAKKKGGGYQVAEYDSMYDDKEYETKEYETTEYKSVYDN